MKWTIRSCDKKIYSVTFDLWVVSDGAKMFESDTESDAQWLCDTLNKLEAQ